MGTFGRDRLVKIMKRLKENIYKFHTKLIYASKIVLV